MQWCKKEDVSVDKYKNFTVPSVTVEIIIECEPFYEEMFDIL